MKEQQHYKTVQKNVVVVVLVSPSLHQHPKWCLDKMLMRWRELVKNMQVSY